MGYTNSNDFTFVKVVTDPSTNHIIGTVYKTRSRSGGLIKVDNSGNIVDFPDDFNNGVVKQESGIYSVNKDGKWVPCRKADAKKTLNAEMGYAPHYPEVPTQMGE